MRAVHDLLLGPLDVVRLGRLLGYRADTVAHWGIVDGKETNFSLGEPSVCCVVPEIECVDRDVVGLKVVEEAAGVVEVEDIPIGGLKLSGEARSPTGILQCPQTSPSQTTGTAPWGSAT